MPARMTQHTAQFLRSTLEDAGTEYLKLTPSGTEDTVLTDAATEYLALSAFATQEGPLGATDTATEDLKLTPSTPSEFRGRTLLDTATEYIKLIPVGFESDVAYFDTLVEQFRLTPVAVDEAQFGAPDAGTELLLLTPSSDDHMCPQKVEFEGDLDARWSAERKNRWSASEEGRWQAVFLGVGEGFAC